MKSLGTIGWIQLALGCVSFLSRTILTALGKKELGDSIGGVADAVGGVLIGTGGLTLHVSDPLGGK